MFKLLKYSGLKNVGPVEVTALGTSYGGKTSYVSLGLKKITGYCNPGMSDQKLLQARILTNIFNFKKSSKIRVS